MSPKTIAWRLILGGADRPARPPLRPVFAEPSGWNLLLLTNVPVAMIALVPLARALRPRTPGRQP